MSELRIDLLTSAAEFDQCVELQVRTWQYTSTEAFPRRIFLIASRIGGHVLGAFQGNTLAGFCLGLPAYRDGAAYLHSQMLAVDVGLRNAGVGRRLKLAQRKVALEQGLDRIEWTFDPLDIKNGYFNLHRLGAISRRYARDFYGPSTSPLQGGLPTDRLYAEWWIRSERTARALKADAMASTAEREIRVPAEITQWKCEGDGRALAEQRRIGIELTQAFAMGLHAAGYRRDGSGNGFFQLSRADEMGGDSG